MSNKIKVRWEVSDGYIGQRAYAVEVDLDEFQNCETADEVEDLLSQIIQDDFEQRVSWSVKDMDGVVNEIVNLKVTP